MSFPHHSSRLHCRVEEIFKSTEKLPIAGGKKRMANIQLFPRNGLLSLPTIFMRKIHWNWPHLTVWKLIILVTYFERCWFCIILSWNLNLKRLMQLLFSTYESKLSISLNAHFAKNTRESSWRVVSLLKRPYPSFYWYVTGLMRNTKFHA